MSQVKIHTPGQIIRFNQKSVQIQFNTFISHRTNIHRNTGITGRSIHRFVIKHISSLTAKVFNSTAQSAFKEFKIKTCVETMRSFPSDIFITFIRKSQCKIIITVRNSILIQVRIVITDIIITLCTITDFELQHINPRCILQE